jgi:amino acid transporter/nucleotide-binding universal stress UspA family protein
MAKAGSDRHTDRAEVQLSRDLGLFSVTMMGVGGMIGAGIFALSGIAAGAAGPAVVLVFIFNGIVTFLTALAYAELGAAFPRAGGGYVWVKEGLGGGNGFLAGWMSWFGYVVAGALYAIAFGGFALDSWLAFGLPTGGVPEDILKTVFTVVVILLFTGLNMLGSEETGAMGAVITVIKIAILGLFVAFGAAAMFGAGNIEGRFFTDPLPNGVTGILAGMGLTFIAFEGYEIIAQSGEEIIKPARNVPRGIFLSIAIAVIIYVAVGIVAVGAIDPPEGMAAYQFLGQERELAIVSVARQIFPWGSGGALMLISGLAATVSALNVTVFSASRVSFAMGREHNLPPVFARIHRKRLTPFVAVLVTGGLMLLTALLLPIETAATAGGVMFLLMFIQVNMAVISLRRTHPDVARGFRVPFFPVPALIAIVVNAALVLYIISYDAVAVWTAFAWMVTGLLAYYTYFEHKEALEAPRAIVHEEAVGKHGYTIVVAVRDDREAAVLGWFASALAKARDGGLLATHMLEVPRALSLNEARPLIKSGQGYFETIREAAKARKIETHTLIMIARRTAHALEKLISQRAADFVLFAWSGKTKRGRTYGRTIDPLLANPPADMAIVRPASRMKRTIETVLVPVDGSANSRMAVELAADLGKHIAGRAHAAITLLRVTSTKKAAEAGDKDLFAKLLDGIDYGKIETVALAGASEANTILDQAREFDLVIVGASDTSPLGDLFRRKNRERFSPRTTKRILRDAKPTTVMVKRRPAILRSFLQRTIFSG